MDGLNEHLDSPIGWAALVIADHFELSEDGYSAELDDIKKVVEMPQLQDDAGSRGLQRLQVQWLLKRHHVDWRS